MHTVDLGVVAAAGRVPALTDGRRRELRRRYLRLGVGEFAAATVFAAVAATTVVPRLDDPDAQVALWSGLIPLLVVLVQAGVYWLLARAWVEQGPMPATLAAVYGGFRVADVVLLLVGLTGALVWMPGSPGAVVLVMAIWLFAVVEYANYFVVRLAYPIGRWRPMVGQMRTPRLVQDICNARVLPQP